MGARIIRMVLTRTSLIGSAGKTSFIWLSIILGAVYISGLLTDVGKRNRIEYTQYKNYLENGDIAKGVIMGDVFHGEFKIPQTLNTHMEMH